MITTYSWWLMRYLLTHRIASLSFLHTICWPGELQEAAGWADGRGVPGVGPGAERAPQPPDREPARGQARGPQGHQVTYGHKPSNGSTET